jgi:plasmid maintenance system antidote protein VapI
MSMQSQYDLWRARKAKQPSVSRLANVADISERDPAGEGRV